MGFQTQVKVQPGLGVAGDFCDSNPRFTVPVGQGGMVAGVSCFVGRFCWTSPPLDPEGTATICNSFGSGSVTGFMAREQQGLITTYLTQTSNQVAPGFQCGLFSGGDFLVTNSGSTQCNVGMKAYANYANGLVSFALTGSPLTGGTATGTIAPATFSVTGSIANNIMTVTVIGSGTLYPGALITSGAATGTAIVNQLTGTNGGVGTYTITPNEQTVASTTLSGTYGLFTAVSALTSSFAVGDILSGSGGGGVTAGTTITAASPSGALTGVGGLGTYVVQTTQTVTSSTISATSNVETKWVAMSAGLAGELIKISDHPLG